jgi:hypothetical protein
MGHTRFPPKETKFPLFMPQGHTAKPEKLAMAASKGRAFATKSPANAGRFNFRANRISAVNTDRVFKVFARALGASMASGPARLKPMSLRPRPWPQLFR